MLRNKLADYYWTPPPHPPPAAADVTVRYRTRLRGESEMDDALAASFPASDPPGWNPGMAQPDADHGDVESPTEPAARQADHGRQFLDAGVTFGAAAGLALLVPFIILIAGLPVVLLVRGVAEVVGWLVGRLLT